MTIRAAGKNCLICLVAAMPSVSFHLYIHQDNVREVLAISCQSLAAVAALEYFTDEITDYSSDHPSHWLAVIHD